MSTFGIEWLDPYIFILLAGALPTAIWRWAGVVLVGGIEEDAEFLVFVRCVATALVAAVIAQLILFPGGVLSEIAVEIRVSAAIAGFLAYLISSKLWIAILIGQSVLVTGMALFGFTSEVFLIF